MLGFLTRLLGNAVAPLLDQVSRSGAELLRKAALFILAAFCLVVVIIALTIAFDLWISTLAGPIVGALAVAGVYLAVAIAAIAFALLGGRRTDQGKKPAARPVSDRQARAQNAQVDDFVAPLMAALSKLGLRREQFAVIAGSSLAKQLGPIPLVGLAIVAGFLAGRMWKSWRSVLSMDAVAALLTWAVQIIGEHPDTTSAEGDDLAA